MNVLLGVTGSIACYKALEIAREFIRSGDEVRVVMTDAAKEFVTPLSFASLTGHPVYDSFWEEGKQGQMSHIALSDWADLFCIAPASADCIAGLAHGFANDPVRAVFLATLSPVVIAPAMNVNMYNAPSVQSNLKILKDNNQVTIVHPEVGELACGWQGIGRLADPVQIVAHCRRGRASKDRALDGKHVLISAGSTREPIDAVRFISNRSSGSMGVALAEAAMQAGARVTLVHGPVSVDIPRSLQSVPVETATDMFTALQDVIDRDVPDLVFMAAAVADFRPARSTRSKLKKEDVGENIALVRNVDILKELCSSRTASSKMRIVGFCVETGSVEYLLSEAKRKLTQRNCDYIVANLAEESLGLESARVFIVSRHEDAESEEIGPASKKIVAEKLLNFIVSDCLSETVAELSVE